MHQGRQRAAPDDEPRHEGAELRGRQDVDLEHGDGVWADGLVPVPVDAELGEFEADARPEVLGVLDLSWVCLVMVDVDVAGRVSVGSGGRGRGGTDKPPRMPLSRGSGNAS